MSLSDLKAKPDLNTTLPVRQTASIFKQPVTKVTNHPNNKVKTDPQKTVDQPKQVSEVAVWSSYKYPLTVKNEVFPINCVRIQKNKRQNKVVYLDVSCQLA